MKKKNMLVLLFGRKKNADIDKMREKKNSMENTRRPFAPTQWKLRRGLKICEREVVSRVVTFTQTLTEDFSEVW